MGLRAIVAENYDELEKCYGHCEQPANLKFLNNEEDPVVTGYSCHAAYLSRIIIYSHSLTLQQSVDMISRLVGPNYEVKEDDVRLASRYPWDLGISSGKPEKMMTVAYWTQNYRRTKSEDPNRIAIFLCVNCNSIFSQQLSERNVLCTDCRTRKQSEP
jgi:hypothetical protein